ncbi:MmcQ/YjbR family DNA-binding protein [Micromonospora sp. KC213]|uniref:MmcQ/YjbR family DNA-binding protein n=1 Tax=Micromonospora sp. KC213 TaxID=2530378 RepID=UPI00104FEAF3|nr:MmcQ/YjbR family DNA-binding protein [Micromonospora sp. KC213]TDC41861.1 MmcQ/YjbR family DNA-binding protein [Micromonospora sp. KC213]
MSSPADVAPELLDRLRLVCLRLPETYEEPAWVGVRWRIRKRTFAHVLTVDADHQAARHRAAPPDQPVAVLILRAPVVEAHALVAGGPPFYRPGWGDDVLGMVLDEDTDWGEVAELLTESYCLLAPRKLTDRVAPVADRAGS